MSIQSVVLYNICSTMDHIHDGSHVRLYHTVALQLSLFCVRICSDGHIVTKLPKDTFLRSILVIKQRMTEDTDILKKT
jgi:hypothetical protein